MSLCSAVAGGDGPHAHDCSSKSGEVQHAQAASTAELDQASTVIGAILAPALDALQEPKKVPTGASRREHVPDV
eukprot:598175-Amphidinium_carterae.1